MLAYGVPLHITSMAYRTGRRVSLTARLFSRWDARQEAGYLAEQRVAVAAAREPQRVVARLLEVAGGVFTIDWVVFPELLANAAVAT